MKILRHGVRLLSVISAVVLLDGCATSALWSERAYCEPSAVPELRLSFNSEKEDVLVQYQEIDDRSFKPRERAYFLYQNQKKLATGRKPAFTKPEKAGGLIPLLIVTPEEHTAQVRELELYAVAETNSPTFAVYSKDRELGVHDLPVYGERMQLAGQVALTPLAVAADVIVVGTVVLIIAWAESGGNCY